MTSLCRRVQANAPAACLVCVCIVVVAHCVQSGLANAVLVGRVNIRQLRVKLTAAQSSCHNSPSQCHTHLPPLYSETSRDKATFTLPSHRSFHYHTETDTTAAPYHGHFALYGGDGYLWSFPTGYDRYDLVALLFILF